MWTEVKIWILRQIFNIFFWKDKEFKMQYLRLKLGLIENEDLENWMENQIMKEHPTSEDLNIL